MAMTAAPCITISSSRSSIASPPSTPNPIPMVSSSQQLSQLSRNASVISTSSSSSASSVAATPPIRPRPQRQFSYQPPSRPRSPTEQTLYDRTRSPSRQRTHSPHSPTTPRAIRAPPHILVPRELGRPDSDEDSDSALPELSAPTSRRGSTVAHSRKGSVSTLRRPDMPEQRGGFHSRSGSGSVSGASDGARPVIAPPASPKTMMALLTGSPNLGPRSFGVGPGKRSRAPSTASSAAVLAGQLETVARDVVPPPPPPHVYSSSNLNPSPQPRHTAPSPSPATGQGPRKRRTQSTSTSKARSRSTSAAPRQRQPVSAADFEFGEELGSGSYSTVVKAWFKGTSSGSGNGIMAGLAGAGGQSGEGKVYAVKVSDKQYLINKGKVKYANVEKTALALLGTGNQHHFVLDLVPNGELLARIKRLGSLTANGARYYMAQIVDAVGWMHGMGVIHRDLKPENILLDEAFRVKITDFGSARVESGNPEVPSAPGTEGGSAVVPDQRASSFVGTAEYVSPELLIYNVTSRCSDVWAIGCILFQMLAGRPPFKGGSEYLTLEQVKRLEYVIPDKFDETAGELVKSILVLDPVSRPTIPAIRTHAFLVNTIWDELWTCDAPPMESGPVMGPPPPDSDDEEEDVGQAWDRLVGEDDDEEEEGGPMYFGPKYQGGDAGYLGYQAGMAFHGVRTYGMGAYGSVGADGVGYTAGDSPDDGVTPLAVQRPSYSFGDYKFGDAGSGETSTVQIPSTEDVPPPSQERDITEQPVVVAGPLHTEPSPIGQPPRSSLPPTLPIILSPRLPDADNEIAVEDDDMVPELQSANAPTDQRARTDPLRASHSSTISGVGTTSSSEGSPLGSAIGSGARAGSGERMPIVGGDVEGLRAALAVVGLGGDAERLTSALAPGERPVFLSSILSRPRHRLTAVLPSKRRILVLTDAPRLLCMKEQRDRVVVKSELAFPAAGVRPPSIKSASSTATPVSTNGRGRTLARWKSSSSAPGAGNAGSNSGVNAAEGEGREVEPIALETVESIEAKGEKSFVIQTLSKAYTYVAENPEEAQRWVQQIKAVQHRKPRQPSLPSSRPGQRAVPAENLLQLLEGFTYREFNTEDSVKVSVPRPLPVGYFNRFNLYAPHIRELDYYLVELLEENDIPLFAERSPSDDVRFLQNSVHPRLSLPNLDRFTLGRPGGIWCHHHDLSLITLLLPPSLTEFAVVELTRFDDEPEAKRFFEFLGTRIFSACPAIQNLRLFHGGVVNKWIAEHIDKWHLFEDLPALAQLSSISLSSDILNVETINWISRLPDLSSLTFRTLEPFNCSTFQRTAYPDFSFRNLRVLVLERCDVGAVTQLWKTPIISQLERLTFSPTTDQLDQLGLFFELLASQSRQLTKAHISSIGIEALKFTPSEIESQPQLNLVDLFISFVGLEGDCPVRAIAMLWPSLRRLTLDVHFAKLEEFLQLPVLLPHLECLEVGIPAEFWDVSQLMKIPSSTPKSVVAYPLNFCTNLPFLDKEPKSMFIYLFARFFVQWWPGVQFSPNIHESIPEKQTARLEAYSKVNAK
ncbi:pkb-activating kinase-like protein, partial [Ceratobasidium sp. 370]